jgi:gamma-glutamyl hercynylcysteine S-oxide synthase
MRPGCTLLCTLFSLCSADLLLAASLPAPTPSQELARHLISIAALAQPAPEVTIPAGPFSIGSKRVDDDPYGHWTQFDDTELPQNRVWLDTYKIDRDEVSLGEYLAFLQQRKDRPADELQKLIWHVITIHSVSDQTLARWPALYITWHEAKSLCVSHGKRLPTEAEWEKAARGGANGRRFPWADSDTITHSWANYYGTNSFACDISPTQGYHPSFAAGATPYTSPVGYFAANDYGLHDLVGNVWEWCWDWCGSGLCGPYPSGSQTDPIGPARGSTRAARGGGWNSYALSIRAASRSYLPTDFSRNEVGFRTVLPRSQP